mmetsp:Transcript_11120/g.32025  ORF Transcript_11120/g.32025 Transcript_11120/m.32025 type:complete len:253 (+) Transcript_11120:873-1631(+)
MRWSVQHHRQGCHRCCVRRGSPDRMPDHPDPALQGLQLAPSHSVPDLERRPSHFGSGAHVPAQAEHGQPERAHVHCDRAPDHHLCDLRSCRDRSAAGGASVPAAAAAAERIGTPIVATATTRAVNHQGGLQVVHLHAPHRARRQLPHHPFAEDLRRSIPSQLLCHVRVQHRNLAMRSDVAQRAHEFAAFIPERPLIRKFHRDDDPVTLPAGQGVRSHASTTGSGIVAIVPILDPTGTVSDADRLRRCRIPVA